MDEIPKTWRDIARTIGRDENEEFILDVPTIKFDEQNQEVRKAVDFLKSAMCWINTFELNLTDPAASPQIVPSQTVLPQMAEGEFHPVTL